MYMRFLRKISIAVAAITALCLVACSNETDTTLTQQQSTISKYLEGSHKPRLIAEEEIASSMDDEPQFYTHWGLDIYRYISTYYDEGREERAVVEHGSKLELKYSAYIFTNSTPNIANMFATNDPDSIAALESEGLNTSYEWSTEPLKVTIGNGDVLESIETALLGCHEGDHVEIYLTFEAGYGKDYLGKVPSKSPLVWIIDINNVKM
jgi:hypothetical protein